VRAVVGLHAPHEGRRGRRELAARERLRLEVGLEQLARDEQAEVRKVDVRRGRVGRRRAERRQEQRGTRAPAEQLRSAHRCAHHGIAQA
jgi:hypothetical protein